MKILEIMSSNIETLKPTQSIRVAARKMSQLNIGFFPIVTDGGDLVGVITDRDICCFIVAMGRDPNSTEIQKCMTTNVVFCFEDQDITKAAQLMELHNLQRIIVLDHNNKFVGIISIDDLAIFSGDLAGTVLQLSNNTLKVEVRNGN